MDLTQYMPSQRYAGKASQYSRYRPTYPASALEVLRRELGPAARAIADIGAGTGLFSRPLLEAGFQVHAVEPNADMRREAESSFAGWENFRSIPGTAEATMLPAASMDAVSCAQSFHWFAVDQVISEFRRILKPGGAVFLIWNNQRFGLDDFHREYEAVLRRGCPDYDRFKLASVGYTPETLRAMFGTPHVTEYHRDNEQLLDLDGLKGRISSVSYCPRPDSAAYRSVMDAVDTLFSIHQCDGLVRIQYDVEMYCIRFAD